MAVGGTGAVLAPAHGARGTGPRGAFPRSLPLLPHRRTALRSPPQGTPLLGGWTTCSPAACRCCAWAPPPTRGHCARPPLPGCARATPAACSCWRRRVELRSTWPGRLRGTQGWRWRCCPTNGRERCRRRMRGGGYAGRRLRPAAGAGGRRRARRPRRGVSRGAHPDVGRLGGGRRAPRGEGVPCVLVSPCPGLDILAAGALTTTSRTEERHSWPAVEVVDRGADDPRTGLFSSPRCAGAFPRAGAWCVCSTGQAVCAWCRAGRAASWPAATVVRLSN